METSALVLAIIGLGISGTLALIKIWEAFLSQAKLDVEFDWIEQPKEFELRVTVANLGHRKDGIRALSIVAAGNPFQRNEIRALLPSPLNPRELASFTWTVDRDDVDEEPRLSMKNGDAELSVIDIRKRELRFKIPALDVAWSGRRSVREEQLQRRLE
jgi:hypothetical protein